MSITRKNVKDEVEAQKWMGKLELDTSKLYKWFNELENRVYELKIAVDPLRYLSTSTYSVSNAVADRTQAIPTDLKSMDGKELGLWTLDQNSRRSDPLTITEIEAGDQGYVIVGDNFEFTGFSDNQISVKLWYEAEYVPKTTWTDGDTLNFPTEDEPFYLTLAMNWVKFKYFEDEEDMAAEVEALGKYEAMIQEMEMKMDRNPDSVRFASNFNVY